MASIDVEDVLSKLTEREKISLLAGRYPLSPSTAVNASLAFLTISVQVLTSGTHNPYPNMASPLYDSPTVPMASAAPASSTAPQQPVSPAAQL
jgi:hypothetical protein